MHVRMDDAGKSDGGDSTDDGGLGGGTIAGIIIGCLVAIAAVVGVVVVMKGRQAKNPSSRPADMDM